METKKMSLANIHGKLSRAEMKKIMAGSKNADRGAAPICTACTRDSECPPFKVCKSSPSCIYQTKVCAKPLYC